ncbi:MAG: ThuA domain-containing protein, partial [Saprospiraceae bacterium]
MKHTMRLPNRIPVLLILPLAVLFMHSCDPNGGIPPRILVFSKTEGYRHQSIPVATAALRRLCADHGIAMDTTEDAADFT